MLTSCDDQRPQRAGFIMLVYGTYKVQNGSLNDALYGGPSTEDNDGYPGSVSGESNSYYGYSRSAIEVNANTYINSAGQSGTGFLNYVDCGEVKDHLFENDTLSESSAPTPFQAFAAGYATEDYRDLYLQRNCYVGKSGLVALGVLTGLVGLFLIPASLCSAFCVSRRCNRTLNMWVAAMLTAAALALSIVCIWAITLYGATNQVLNQAIWCEDIEETAYYDDGGALFNLGADRTPPNTVTGEYWNVPTGCYSGIDGENEDQFLENLAKNWAVAMAGAILILLTSLLLMGFLACIAQNESDKGLRKEDARHHSAPAATSGPQGPSASHV